jgi:C-5 cytosine-specific DNA methylase
MTANLPRIRPLLLDLFCGAGGAAMGYHRGGFDVIGVDINPQKNYPFEFHQMDALACDATLIAERFDAIHASPPCQRYTTLAKGNNSNHADHPDLINASRALINATRLPYVIENVPSAPLINPIMLCGEMFGLAVIRHRLFESNVQLEAPTHKPHRGRVSGYRHGQWYDGPYFAVYGNGGGKGSLDDWRTAMGMDWPQTKREIAEAIPPHYAEYVGAQIIAALRHRA